MESSFIAEINGTAHQIKMENKSIVIKSQQLNGKYTGKLHGSQIVGFWLQKGYLNYPGFVSPLNLISNGDGVWKATLIPFQEKLTISIQFNESDDRIIPIIRNREMNLGIFLNIAYVQIEDNIVRFYSKDDNEKFQGSLNGSHLQLKFELWGNAYELTLESKEPLDSIGYYPKTIQKSEEKIQFTNLHKLILNETYPNVQGVFISQNGKKMFEEYYYGYNQNEVHDTRSAGKSLASILIGICIDKGYINSEDDFILDYFPNYVPNKNWSDLKKSISIKHLMTMASGLDCDDNNDESLGTEDRMQTQQEELDWYKFTLDLPMVGKPGEASAYATAGVNLLGGIIRNSSNMTIYELADKYLFRPLGITEYFFNIQPNEDTYLGGGIHLKLQDQAKIGELMLNKGNWNGVQVISRQWVEKTFEKYNKVNGNWYGYNWWHYSCIVKNKNFESYNAGGNGGQYIIITPPLKLVCVLSGGNYNRWLIWSKYIHFLEDHIISTFLVED